MSRVYKSRNVKKKKKSMQKQVMKLIMNYFVHYMSVVIPNEKI